jgi:hypothetical protein
VRHSAALRQNHPAQLVKTRQLTDRSLHLPQDELPASGRTNAASYYEIVC